MARNFVSASSQQLTGNPPLTAVPCTMACWARPTASGNIVWPMSLGNTGGGNFLALGLEIANTVRAYQFDGTTGSASSAGTFTLNAWNHIGAVFTSTTAETAYLNGVGTSASHAAVVPAGIDIMRMAQLFTQYFDGDLAEAAIWNVALTSGEMTQLSKGVSPLLIRPSALVAYWPLVHGYNTEIDLMSGHFDLTLSGAPTYVKHPPMVRPVGLKRHRLAHAAPGTTIAIPVGSLTLAGQAPTVGFTNPTITLILAQLALATADINTATTLTNTLTASTGKDAVLVQLGIASTAVATASSLVSSLGSNLTQPQIDSIQAQLTIALNALNNAIQILNSLLQVGLFFVYEAFLNGAWADLTADVIHNQIDWLIGITGDGPMDCIAGSGTCTFQLRNDAHDGKPLGYYSPNNPNVRPGWMFSVPFRVRALYNGFYYPRFYGKISSILPDTGPRGRRQVSVIAYDIMRTLAEVDVQQIAIQVGKSESQVIAAIIASLPASEQPIGLDLNPGVDILDYSLDNVGTSAKALSLLADVAHSSFYLIAQVGNGTLIGRSRYTRTTVGSSFTFNGDFLDLQVPADLTEVFNLVKLTSHPRNIDVAATTVLYSMTGVVPFISPNDTVTFWGTYNDQSNDQRLIGGLDVVTTLIPYPTGSYDYAGNTLIDGTGADMTSSLTVVATAFATTVKFDITNNASVPVYLVATGTTVPALRIRGRGVYDKGPQQFQSFIEQSYGTRMFTADLPYQGNANVTQAACEYIQAAYNSLTNRASKITFVAKETPTKLFFALTVEPGDRITISEPMTGLTAVDSIVQSVAFSIVETHVVCTLGLAPANASAPWLWGIAGKSEWGVTTFYGF